MNKRFLLLLTIVFTMLSCGSESRGDIGILYPKYMFYFNSLTEYTLEDGDKVNSTISIESGSIHIYVTDSQSWDVIKIKREKGITQYYIIEGFHDEEDNIYYYTLTDYGPGDELYMSSLDVNNKRLRIETLYDGIEFFISTDINIE